MAKIANLTVARKIRERAAEARESRERYLIERAAEIATKEAYRCNRMTKRGTPCLLSKSDYFDDGCHLHRTQLRVV